MLLSKYLVLFQVWNVILKNSMKTYYITNNLHSEFDVKTNSVVQSKEAMEKSAGKWIALIHLDKS